MLTPKTNYEQFAYKKTMYANLKFLATAILVSALEDADVEFLESDYEEWKKIRLSYKKKSENLTELDLKREFEAKENYKEVLSDIGEITLSKNDIPSDILNEREMYEFNKSEKLSKLTGYKFDTLMNNAKLHGWKIGCRYEEPTIFDL